MKLWNKFINALFQVDKRIDLQTVQCGVLANSNAISTASGDFARLTKEVKKFLGLAKQKALYC